jgi:hypothetical protein
MTDLAERTTGSTYVEETELRPGRTPPDEMPPVAPRPSAPWPSRAKLLIALLAVAALLGVAGTIIGFATGDGTPASEQELESRITELIAERDALADQVPQLQSMIDNVAAEREDLVDQVSDLDMTITELTAERDDLAQQLAVIEATTGIATEDLVGQLAELDATIDALTIERDGLARRVTVYESSLAMLRADLFSETDRAVTAEAERDVLADLFPITFDASLDGVAVEDLEGTYDVSFNQAYCNGFTTCGTDLTFDELTLEATTEGYLTVEIDDLVTAGMYRVDGALYAVAESTPDVTACGTTPRPARTAVTIFAYGIAVADDGTHQVTDLGASLTIQSEAGGTCGAGLAFYGTELTPQT